MNVFTNNIAIGHTWADFSTPISGRTYVTCYQIEIAPEAYWQILSDALIHRIHERVFEHIKREVELGAGA